MKLFDLVDDASHGKTNLFESDPEAATHAYSAWVVNRHFSNFGDSVFVASELNALPWMDADMQFAVYSALLPRRKRFSKWHKAEKDVVVERVSEYYGINKKRAAEAVRVMGDATAEEISSAMGRRDDEGVPKKRR